MTSVLGHCIGPSATATLSLELSHVVIHEAKQGDMEHSVDGFLAGYDVLDEAKPAIAHVGKSDILVPATLHVMLLVVAAKQLLLEHPAFQRPFGGGAA